MTQEEWNKMQKVMNTVRQKPLQPTDEKRKKSQPVQSQRDHKPEGVRFMCKSLGELKQMTEEEFESLKEKARRWQPTSR